MHRWLALLPVLAGLLWSSGVDAADLPEGQFRPLGPFGARVTDLCGDPTRPGRVYAATGTDGVYRSDDAGGNWYRVSQGLPLDALNVGNAEVLSLAVDPGDGRVYASLGNGDLYATDDDGSSWQRLPRPTGVRGGFARLVIDRDDPTRICASNGRLGQGVFVTLDRGQTWAPSSQGLGSPSIHALAGAPSDPDVFYVAAGDRLYRTTAVDGAWTEAGPLPAGHIAGLQVDPADPEILWLATGAGAFRSGNGGQSWDRLDDPQDPVAAERFLLGATVTLITRGATYTWDGETLTDPEPFYHTQIRGSAATDQGVVIGAAMGVFRRDASGFTYSSQGMLNTDVTGIAPAQNSDVLYVACGLGHEAGVFRSPNNGRTWELRSLGITNLDARSIAVAPSDPDVVYMGTVDASGEGGENGKIFRTVDGGLTWTDISAGIEAVHDEARIIIDILVHPTDPNKVWASVQALFGGIFYSADGGATWQRRADGLESMPPQGNDWDDFVDYFAMLSLDLDPMDPNRIYIGAGGCWGGVYISDDQGAHWTRKDENAMEVDETVLFPAIFGLHLELFDFMVDPRDPTHLIAGGGRGLHPDGSPQVGIVFESRDRGESWQILHEKRPNSSYFDNPVTGVVIDALDSERLYVATRGGVQVSEQGGAPASWTFINEGLDPRAEFTRNAVMDPDDPAWLYVSTAFRGLWARQVNPTPVRLTHLDGEALGDRVVLTWGVADAVGHAGFHVDREVRGGSWDRLTPRLLAGSDEYRFEDASPVAGVTNRYRLVEVDRRGAETVVGTLEVPVPLGPGMVLGAAFPNPLRDATRLKFTTRAEAPVRARVFDSRGRLVTTLLEQMLQPGTRELVWDRSDDASRRVAAGFYVIHVEQAGQAATRKVLVLP